MLLPTVSWTHQQNGQPGQRAIAQQGGTDKVGPVDFGVRPVEIARQVRRGLQHCLVVRPDSRRPAARGRRLLACKIDRVGRHGGAVRRR